MVRRESLRHSEAFEYYYSLGDKRTLKKVCIKFNVSAQSTSAWVRKFGWRQRIKERNKDEVF